MSYHDPLLERETLQDKHPERGHTRFNRLINLFERGNRQTGLYETWHSNGEPSERSQWLDGKRHGITKSYDQSEIEGDTYFPSVYWQGTPLYERAQGSDPTAFALAYQDFLLKEALELACGKSFNCSYCLLEEADHLLLPLLRKSGDLVATFDSLHQLGLDSREFSDAGVDPYDYDYILRTYAKRIRDIEQDLMDDEDVALDFYRYCESKTYPEVALSAEIKMMSYELGPKIVEALDEVLQEQLPTLDEDELLVMQKASPLLRPEIVHAIEHAYKEGLDHSLHHSPESIIQEARRVLGEEKWQMSKRSDPDTPSQSYQPKISR